MVNGASSFKPNETFGRFVIVKDLSIFDFLASGLRDVKVDIVEWFLYIPIRHY